VAALAEMYVQGSIGSGNRSIDPQNSGADKDAAVYNQFVLTARRAGP
jgi:hypothetical protein